ncbi:MAG: hypothetical protein ACI9Y7_000652 [Dokdonia sp.]|jgi:hypothetical protein
MEIVKKVIFIVFLLPVLAYSQKDETLNKFKFHATSISPLSVYVYSFEPGAGGGLALSADVSFEYSKKHLFSLGVATGSEINILGPSNNFGEINVLYGREFALSRTLFFEVHGGAGYFNFSSRSGSRGTEHMSTIGFPLVTKLRIMTGSRFSLGVQIKGNFNSIKSYYTGGLILQWNRKRSK